MSVPLFQRLFRLTLALAGVLAFAGIEAQAGYNDLLATNLGGGNVTQYDPTTGASLGAFESTTGSLPRGIAVGPDQNVYVGDLNGGIYQFNGITGSPAPSPFVAIGTINSPHGIAFGPNGDLFVSSFGGNNVLQFQGPGGATPGALVGTFATGSGLLGPTGLGFGGPGDNLFVASSTNNQILEYNGTTGAFIKALATGGPLNGPAGLSFASDGTLLVANDTGNSVLRYDVTTGALLNTITDRGLVHPSSAVYDGDGHLLVASWSDSEILRFNLDLSTNAASFDSVFVSGNGLDTPIYLSLVPEPGSVVLLGLGLAGVAGYAVRKRRFSRA